MLSLLIEKAERVVYGQGAGRSSAVAACDVVRSSASRAEDADLEAGAPGSERAQVEHVSPAIPNGRGLKEQS